MTLWNAEGLKPIVYLVWPLRSLKVRNQFFTLTWPSDLTFGDLGLKLLHKVSNSIVSRYWKNGGAARSRFSTIREKPEGWAFFAPPLQCACYGALEFLFWWNKNGFETSYCVIFDYFVLLLSVMICAEDIARPNCWEEKWFNSAHVI